MKCPRCKSEKFVKAGKKLNRQRYLCKNCRYWFTRFTSRGKPSAVKKLALHMYLEGMSIRAIARVLKVSHVAVFKWIKQAGEKLYVKRLAGYGQNDVEVMEIDELASYIQSKKNGFGYGLLMIEFAKSRPHLKLALANTAQQ